ncbi:restriction endonuclease subunit S, partial [Thiolapillus sp.]|uniref:restriction endonuclease subunit S n=3 Tax=Thiolapillus sp. TaxID=2017437 RepID=UPI003AF4CC94
MGYKTYPEYRDSGVQWLGEMPSHWETRRLKYAAPLRNIKIIAGESHLPYVGLENIESWSGKYLVQDAANDLEGLSSRFYPGDVLFGKLRPYLAKAFLADFEGMCSSELLVLQGKGVQPEFLVRFMLSVGFIREVDSSTYGAKMPRASWDFIGNLLVTLPPTGEQTTIAAFLDEKTTQIDQLIEKKTRFIELLKEKRAALVTEAVTGKFDARTGKPYAEYKDSGVEWLGKVPAHWEVKPLKRGYSVKLGKMLQPVQQAPQDVLKPYLRASNIQPDGIYVSGVKEMWFSPLELGVLRLKYGDLLVSEGGDVGRSAIWRRELEEAYYQNSINRVRGLEGNNNYYLNYLLSCIKESGAIDVICNRLSIAHLTTEKLNEIQILFPTAEEQSAIAAFLDEKTTQVDQLIEKTQQSIDLLKEKRAALITAAVTGKIDVRNERI